MTRSKLSDDQWRALFDDEMAGLTRRELGLKYGLHPGTISRQASICGLLKRQTGAPDHRRIPPGGWPPDRVIPQNPVGMTGREWDAALDRYLAGEDAAVIAADIDVRPGAVTSRAHAVGRQKKQTPGAVRRPTGPKPGAWEPDPDEPEDAPAAPPLTLRPAQQPPDGPWSTWLFLGGRGAGKTLAGASWLADQAEALGAGGRLALIGPTLHDVREVMIEGVSGIRSLPRWTHATRPRFQSSRRRLVFANGCQAYAFSAEDPDSLRGPQFSAAWADEFCAWRGSGPRGAAETLALLRMGLRLPLAPSTASGGPPPPAEKECEPGGPGSILPRRGRGLKQRATASRALAPQGWSSPPPHDPPAPSSACATRPPASPPTPPPPTMRRTSPRASSTTSTPSTAAPAAPPRSWKAASSSSTAHCSRPR